MADDDLSEHAGDNLYEAYRLLRENDPVHWSDSMNAWVVTCYDDVAALLVDKRLTNDRIGAYMAELSPTDQDLYRGLGDHFRYWLGFTEGETHERLRGLQREILSPKLARDLQLRIGQIVDESLDAIAVNNGGDLVADLAFRLPSVLFYELLGIPDEYRSSFKRLTDAVVTFGGALGPQLAAAAPAAHQAIVELSDYFEELASRSTGESGDIVTALAAAERSGRISHSELVSTLVFIFVAAHDTTVGLIANAFVAFARFPDQLTRLRQDPALVPTAVEEVLRFESPIQMSPRLVLEDIVVRGRRIPRGATVALSNGSANRDPAAFPLPDQFDVSRRPNRHTAFGLRTHFCLGAPLARLEAAEVLDRFIQRFDIWNPTEDIRWLPNLSIRCPTSLHASATAKESQRSKGNDDG